jgi:hypothetical protein
MPKQSDKIGLTRSAVIQRINRKLSANNERLRTVRHDNERLLREVGQFYITGEEGVNRRNVDLEALARRLDVLRPWETILDDG